MKLVIRISLEVYCCYVRAHFKTSSREDLGLAYQKKEFDILIYL